ncbi:MoaD/ThiS family protein [Phytoactinopolyspora halotolerans]|uniref:MoaD/ThiS family protein n=1 Tax=Phytoactinopolyspora halotolerans TaxID=1981512 RepID=A0A6L9SHG6_9ACTN|nr:MoaD/ThiS family protein [Phytoactinopolyspora halotolerans]NEE03761.1 MoaD/ThiS family protein [Phytoactinopolyspora halotolerans]
MTPTSPGEIEVSVPAMLRDCTEGRTRFTIAATTLADAIQQLMTTYPLLRLHVYRDDGQLRPHVLIYLNDQNTAWLQADDVKLKPGDRLAVLQNVSGG